MGLVHNLDLHVRAGAQQGSGAEAEMRPLVRLATRVLIEGDRRYQGHAKGSEAQPILWEEGMTGPSHSISWLPILRIKRLVRTKNRTPSETQKLAKPQ